VVDVSVIIVGWSTQGLVDNCLASVFKETSGICCEVIYVDNGSTDGSVEMVRAKYPSVRVIANQENTGFVFANNQGIRGSQGRYVLLLNSDTIVLENAIAKAVRFADQHPEAAAIGCRVLNPDGTLQRSCLVFHSLRNTFVMTFRLDKLFPWFQFFRNERMEGWDYGQVCEVEVIVGCFSLVRRKAIDQAGLMDADYFFYGDDRDWCYRFHQAGWKMLYTPEPRIIHFGGQTAKRQADQFLLQQYGTLLQFMRKHKSWLEFQGARGLVAVFFLMRVPLWAVRGLFFPAQRAVAWNNLRAYARGGLYAAFAWTRLLMNRQQWEARTVQALAAKAPFVESLP